MNVPFSAEEMNVLLKNDLSSFIHRSFIELNPSVQYLHNWHVDFIASKLNEVRLGTCKRLIINIPPRYLKSICATVAFPAWLLGHDPSMNIICASYGQDLSAKLALDCRNLMMSIWYQQAFPETRISNIAAHDFRTTLYGGRMATSVGGVLTGRGADILIIDDAIKPEDAMSDSQRTAANLWFDGTAYSRLNSKKDGAIIIIMQRLHLDDLVGHVLEKEEWEVLSLPAIAEAETTFNYDTFFGGDSFTRIVGDPLHAERESLDVLQVIRQTIGEYNFAAQYLQSPVPLGGGFIKTNWLKYLAPHEFPQSYDSIIQSWDTASKTNQLADHSVCTTWGSKGGKFYLLDVWRDRVDFPGLKIAVIAQHLKHQPHTILVEDKSSGTALIQELLAAHIYSVKAVIPEGDKKMRLYNKSVLFENGAVCLPEKASWLADYVHEITSFPTAKYDDQVDSTTQALTYLHHGFAGAGIFNYFKMMAEQQKRLCD